MASDKRKEIFWKEEIFIRNNLEKKFASLKLQKIGRHLSGNTLKSFYKKSVSFQTMCNSALKL